MLRTGCAHAAAATLALVLLGAPAIRAQPAEVAEGSGKSATPSKGGTPRSSPARAPEPTGTAKPARPADEAKAKPPSSKSAATPGKGAGQRKVTAPGAEDAVSAAPAQPPGGNSPKPAPPTASAPQPSAEKPGAASRDGARQNPHRGRAPKTPSASLPKGAERPTPDAEARRHVAIGPTREEQAAGKDDPELRALREADRVLFPEPLEGAVPGWSWSTPPPSPSGPAVVASGSPPTRRGNAEPRDLPEDADADFLRTLTMPDLPVRFDRRVVKYLRFYRDNARGQAIAKVWAKKSGKYAPALRAALANAGLPQDLVWLSLIESGHNPTIRSPAGAAGLWQFMPDAGRTYGLTVDRWVDERLDPERATQAALRYLADLNQRFGNWDLAMAAYNMGYGGLSRAIRKFNTNDFFELSRHEAGLPWETTLYVPKILAIAVVMTNRKAFGIDAVSPDAPEEFDTVRVTSGISVVEIATASETPIEQLLSFNPQLLANRTPPAPDPSSQRTWPVRVPKGKGVAALQKLAKSSQPDELEPYVARFGDTFEDIAVERGTTAARVQWLNGVSKGEPLGAGDVLLLPRSGAQASAAPRVVVVPPRKFHYPDRRRAFYVVLTGDSIAAVARAFHVTPTEIVTWNSLDGSARLVSGMTLQLYVPKSADLSRTRHLSESGVRALVAGSDDFFDYFEGLNGRRRVTVEVREGDTLAGIGRRYGLSVGSMERINRVARSTKLEPGDEVVVYTKRTEPTTGATTEGVAEAGAPEHVEPPHPELLPAVPSGS